jgi:uncharacterized damage-inducible protein DinB
VALLRPAVDGNHIAFLALHLLDARTYAANLMSGPPVRHELAEMLESATGIDDIAVFPALEQVTREWGEVCDAFERRLKEQDESSLSAESGRTYPNGRSDLLGVLSFLMHHESYHIGQVNLLRRHAGLKPVSFHE